MATHVVFSRTGNVKLAFSSAYSTKNREMGEQLVQSGDCVKDVCYLVEDVRARFDKAVKAGAVIQYNRLFIYLFYIFIESV